MYFNPEHYVPKFILEYDEPVPAGRPLVEIENSPMIPRPTAAPTEGRALTGRIEERKYEERKVLHARIRNFRGCAEELRAIYNGTEDRNAYFYDAFISQGYRGPDFFSIAQESFNEAVARKKVNTVICNHFIALAGRSGLYEEAKQTFDICCELGIVDPWTVNTFIHIACVHEMWDDAGMVFVFAYRNNLCDTVTGNTLMKSAEKLNHFELSRRIFYSMIEDPDSVDAFTFSIFIKTAGVCGEFEECRRAYQIAKELSAKNKKILNSYVFNNFIFAAAKNGELSEAKEALDYAYCLGHADENVRRTYNNVLCAKIKRISKH